MVLDSGIRGSSEQAMAGDSLVGVLACGGLTENSWYLT